MGKLSFYLRKSGAVVSLCALDPLVRMLCRLTLLYEEQHN